MTPCLETVGTEDPEGWLRRLASVRHDFYHLPDYHRLAEAHGEGQAILFHFAEGERNILLPLLLRPVDRVAGLEQAGAGLRDATSVYGYAGPLASDGYLPIATVGRFQAMLSERLAELGVVTVFSRLHPILSAEACTSGLGELRHQGKTVSIDLTRGAEAQFLTYRSNHRRNIRRLRQEGFECALAEDLSSLEAFIAIYHETMARVDANPWYFFDADYFRGLLEIDGLELMLCRKDGVLVSGAVLSHVGEVAQYHLGGTCGEWLKSAPMKLVFDEARLWAMGHGCKFLHLGGGLGSNEDALFHFKAGFSDQLHDFITWRWALDEEKCRELDAERARRDPERIPGDFFPAYRA